MNLKRRKGRVHPDARGAAASRRQDATLVPNKLNQFGVCASSLRSSVGSSVSLIWFQPIRSLSYLKVVGSRSSTSPPRAFFFLNCCSQTGGRRRRLPGRRWWPPPMVYATYSPEAPSVGRLGGCRAPPLPFTAPSAVEVDCVSRSLQWRCGGDEGRPRRPSRGAAADCAGGGRRARPPGSAGRARR